MKKGIIIMVFFYTIVAQSQTDDMKTQMARYGGTVGTSDKFSI